MSLRIGDKVIAGVTNPPSDAPSKSGTNVFTGSNTFNGTFDASSGVKSTIRGWVVKEVTSAPSSYEQNVLYVIPE